MPLRVAVILGTRPEIIKLSPVLRLLKARGIAHFIVHTGQHYSPEMEAVFFRDLNLDQPAYDLQLGNLPANEQVETMSARISECLAKEQPTIALVQGDTNTVLAGAKAAKSLNILIGHVEAGLRSGDMRMREEYNRIETDKIADFLFVPTEVAALNPAKEGIDRSKIFVTGNTIVDAVTHSVVVAQSRSNILAQLKLSPRAYVLCTIHRAETTDDKSTLSNVLIGLRRAAEEHNLVIVFPIHPRTKKMIQAFGLSTAGLLVIKPAAYLDFLNLMASARLVVTDSGGLQEEACILKVPCVTVRESTERPETVIGGMNIVAGVQSHTITAAIKAALSKKIEWHNPFGDGRAAEKILNIIEQYERARIQPKMGSDFANQ